MNSGQYLSRNSFNAGDIGMNEKEVCVVLSSYNGEKYIKEQIESIIRQKDVEVYLYIRDDGSSDGTVQIIRELMNNNHNIYLEEGENVGFNRSFWFGIRDSLKKFPQCGFFAFADQDDVWDNDKLFCATNFLNPSSERPEMSYSNLLVCDGSLRPIGLMFGENIVHTTYRQSLAQIFCYGCTCVFNRRCAELYANQFYYFPHDCWIYYLGMFCGRAYYDSTPHIKYRRHGKNYGSKGKKISIEKNNLFIKFIDMMKNLGDAKPFISDMATTLLTDYSEEINAESVKYLSTVSRYKNSIKDKCKLLFTSYIGTNEIEKNISLRIYLICNKW